MQKIELYILIENVWQRLETAVGTSIKIDKVSHDVAEIASIFSNITQTFDIPRSNHNTRVLKYLGLNTANVWQYTNPQVRLYIDGFEPLPNAFLANVSVEKWSYSIVIKQGNGNFFDLINGLTLNSFTYGLDDVTQRAKLKWNLTTSVASKNETDIVWPIIDYTGQQDANDMNADYMWPAVYYSHVFDLAFGFAGWSYVMNAESLALLQSMIIPAVSDLASDTVRELAETSARMNLTVYEYTDVVQGVLFANVLSDASEILNEGLIFGGFTDSTVYEVKQSGLYNVRFFFDYSVDVFAGVDIIITIASDLGSIETKQINGTGLGTYEFNQVLALDKGMIIGATINPQLGNSIALTQVSTFDVTDCQFERSAPGLFFDLGFNLPNMNLIEVIRSFMLQTASVIIPDVLEKQLRFVTYKEIIANIDTGTGINLSPNYNQFGNIDYSYIELSRLNWFRYTQDANDIVSETVNDYPFEVEFRNGSQDYITLPFAASNQGFNLAKIPAINLTTPIEYNNVMARVLVVDKQSATVVYNITWEAEFTDTALNIPFTTFEPLRWPNLIQFWADYLRVVKTPEVYSITANIDIIDFANIDLSKPVYFRQFNNYFVLLALTNFTSGRSCDLKLLKIQAIEDAGEDVTKGLIDYESNILIDYNNNVLTDYSM